MWGLGFVGFMGSRVEGVELWAEDFESKVCSLQVRGSGLRVWVLGFCLFLTQVGSWFRFNLLLHKIYVTVLIWVLPPPSNSLY